MPEKLTETVKSDETPKDFVDSRIAVSAYLDALDSNLEENQEFPSGPSSDDEIAVNEAEVKEIAARVGGLSKAMRIVAYNAYHDSTEGVNRKESFELFSSEFYRLAQECDRAVRQFDSVINKAVKTMHTEKPQTIEPDTRESDVA